MNIEKIFVLLALLFFALPVLAAEHIDINTATLEQLDELTGIGPKYAQAIIDNRPYTSVDDLIKVKGIGEKTLQKIKDQGLACVDCGAIQPTEFSAENSDGQVYPENIFINELLPSAQGADEENEWIELYNLNDFSVDLAGWKIQDSVGTKTTYIIPEGKTILANGYLVFSRPETQITLNNEQDTISLLTPSDKAVDSVSYPKATLNQSYSKTLSSWQWSTTVTPGSKNVITSTSAAKGLPKTEKSATNNTAEAGLASLNQTANPVRNEISNGASPWFLFFTALAITITSASIVLFIKFKLSNHVRT